MDTLLQDIRYGFRMLRKSPAVSVAAVLSLALGIGANTVIFSVVNAILLKALPYSDPDRIVLIWGTDADEGSNRNQVSATDADDWRHQNTVFEEVATYGDWQATFIGQGEPERVQGIQVGDGFFQVMRGTPLLGRTFLPEEQEDGKDRVIVLGYNLWQRRFGADPEIVGRAVNLSGRPYTVVGVMPADFQPLPLSLIEPQGQFYRPVAEPHDEDQRSARHLRAIARLKPGVTLQQAQAEMNLIASRIEREHPENNSGYGVRLVTLSEDTVGALRPTLLLLFGAVAFVLLIACANVGNLLLARSTARQKEVAIRAALGAARARLVRQLLTESVMLACVGGGLGLLLAMWGTSFVETLGSQVTPLLSGIRLDGRVLLFTLLVSLVTGIAFGLAPALHISQPDLNETLKEGGRSSTGGSRSALRGLLVVSEVALSIVLLISAGLLIKTMIRLREVNTGFNPQNIVTMNVVLSSAKRPKPQEWASFFKQVTERVEALPGVEAAGLTSVLPFSSNFDGRGLAVEDYPKPRGQEISVDLYITTPGYRRAMGIALLQGRALEEHDTGEAPQVALINETMARELWPNQSPLGKRIKFPGSEKNPQPWRTVVGVVGDVSQYGLDRKVPMQIYLPEAQYPTTAMTLVVRSTTDPSNLVAAIRREVAALDPDQAISNVATMEQLLADSIALRRFSMLLLIIFASMALVLASIGIYGVISYSVTQRTHEIGIRMALGAQTRDVVKLVLGGGMRLVLIGIVLGLAASFALTRLMTSLLYGVSTIDPVTFVAVAVLLSAVALLACYLPARRATKVDPMEALRYE
ncbi:MAG TPA: ABC transporter permease [Pyrinomonadaceae bacterium]|jgi:putative ABC transport system permease protein